MASSKVKCVLNLIKDHFGPVVECVANQLIVNGPSTLKAICFFSKKPVHLVKESLKALIQHNLVEYQTNSREQIEYELKSDNVIAMLRYPRYVLVGSYVDSKFGECLVDEMLKNGKMLLDDLMGNLVKRLSEDLTIQDRYELPKQIYECFVKFVNQGYVVNKDGDKTVPEVDYKKFHEPVVIKKEHGQDDSLEEERPTKKQKTTVESVASVSEQAASQTAWYVNNEQFDEHLRGELVAECIKSHYDDVKAGELARIIYASEKPMARGQIINKAIEDKICETVTEVDTYLKLFDQDLNARFIYRVENTSDGGRFTVNRRNIFHHLIQETLASIVNDYYGDKSGRIFRLLLIKKYLQQKAIGELAMISVKDAKERLSTLFRDGLVRILQFTKAPDYAPMKTSFVITVDLNELCLMFRNKCYHSFYAIASRRNHEYTSNRTLIEKKILIEAIIENLRSTNEEEQINDLDQTFSTHEQAILSRYEMITRKTELSELECERTLFLIDSYLTLKTELPATFRELAAN